MPRGQALGTPGANASGIFSNGREQEELEVKIEALEAQIEVLEGSSFVTGDLKSIANAVVPTGWLICNGAAVSRITFANLFAVIGTKYGEGDKSTTFNVPNGENRTVIGSSGTRAVGSKGGEEKVKLTIGTMPSHFHKALEFLRNVGGGGALDYATGALTLSTGTTTESEGGSEAHENMAPYFTGNWIIKT